MMEVRVVEASDVRPAGKRSCLIVPVFEDDAKVESPLLDQDATARFNAMKSAGVLRGKPSEVTLLPLGTGDWSCAAAVGLGEQAKYAPEILRRATGAATDAIGAQRCDEAVFDASRHSVGVEHALEGLRLGQYRFDLYKKPKSEEDSPVKVSRFVAAVGKAEEIEAVDSACRRAAASCEAANWARDLASTPANDLTPTRLARIAEGMAAEFGLEMECLDAEQMRELGMGALLAVARGSSQPPKLIVLHYKASDKAKTFALVGKGVTFDSGGISIKGSQGMQEMKYDMCGAAAVLGAIRAVGRLQPDVNVLAVVPAVENLPDGEAVKPGDIVRAYNGKTIEINNTDAEGRLILADALSYTADRYKPDCMVDLATLTGAAIFALGHFAAALISPDDGLVDELREAADSTGERIWPLPIWDDYCGLVEGSVGDLSNIGPPKQAGTIVGGAFLKEFAGNVPWAHLDIAGTAWDVSKVPYWKENLPTGYGVRLLTDWLLRKAQERDR
jgi:leucyl aminopeptidase